MKYILAIDLGTQSIRAGIVAAEGRIAAISQLSHEVDCPHPGWAQQKAILWWQECVGVIRDVIARSRISPNDIAGIISCGQMEGPTGIDEQGNIATEWTQLWCDKRCEEQCIHIRYENDEKTLSRITGNVPASGWTGFKVLWIKENMPEVYTRTRYFLVPKDFINYMLTGVAATDYSEASGTFLIDAKTRSYSTEMGRLLGVDINKFAPVHKSYETIGHVSKEAAALTGLAEGTPVMAGGGDFIVSLVALGLSEANTAVDMTGTSTLFVVQKEEPIVMPQISNLMHVLDGWVPFVMLDTGGLNMKWLKDSLSSVSGSDISYDKMIEAAELIFPGSEGLMFYPYLLGERRKGNTNSKGMFSGITSNHRAPHFSRAVMEGTAFALCMNIKAFRSLGVKIDKVTCVGGATRNRLLNRIKADVYQTPIEITDQPEATLIGAYLLGAFGLGMIDDIARTAADCIKIKKVIEPDEKTARIYSERLEEFERLYDHMFGYWK